MGSNTIWPTNCFTTMSNIQFISYTQGKMSENAAKPNAIINGSIIIAVYFIFWVIVTVVLPIISIGLRLYSKESQIKNDQAPDTLQDS